MSRELFESMQDAGFIPESKQYHLLTPHEAYRLDEILEDVSAPFSPSENEDVIMKGILGLAEKLTDLEVDVWIVVDGDGDFIAKLVELEEENVKVLQEGRYASTRLESVANLLKELKNSAKYRR